MLQVQTKIPVLGGELNSNHGFRTLGSFLAGDPRQLDQPVALKSQEAAVVGVTLD